MSYGFKIIVEGDYACFTRPELKVERTTYDVPTPSALEGLLKSIYWKPAIKYVIDRIIVFNDIKYMNIKRNEVKSKGSTSPIYTSEDRTQRSAMILKDVKYGVEFHFELTGEAMEIEDNANEKHYNIIKRRLEKGQFFKVPCLGCAEFPAKKIDLLAEGEDFDLSLQDKKIKESGEIDLGFMVYGLTFEDSQNRKLDYWKKVKGERETASDKANASYYRPKMVNGQIDVAKYAEDVRC
ncbi:MAG: type I-C CRISPR-associated protein Cas5c [Bdellovibrionota bacterium]